MTKHKMKKVLKYGTGQEIPEGAEYLDTVVEESIISDTLIKPRFVWHYFLVECKE